MNDFRSDGPRGFDWDKHIDHGPSRLRAEDSHPMYAQGPRRTIAYGKPVN